MPIGKVRSSVLTRADARAFRPSCELSDKKNLTTYDPDIQPSSSSKLGLQSNAGDLRWVTATRPNDFKSKATMQAVRQTAMGAYLRSTKNIGKQYHSPSLHQEPIVRTLSAGRIYPFNLHTVPPLRIFPNSIYPSVVSVEKLKIYCKFKTFTSFYFADELQSFNFLEQKKWSGDGSQTAWNGHIPFSALYSSHLLI